MKEEDKEYKWLTKEELLKWCAVYGREKRNIPKGVDDESVDCLLKAEAYAVKRYFDRKKFEEENKDKNLWHDIDLDYDYASEKHFVNYVVMFYTRFNPYVWEDFVKIYHAKNPKLEIY